MDFLTGGAARKQQKAQLESQQRKSLADLAKQQGDIDQQTSTGGKGRAGRGLLTFLSGEGQSTFGSA